MRRRQQHHQPGPSVRHENVIHPWPWSSVNRPVSGRSTAWPRGGGSSAAGQRRTDGGASAGRESTARKYGRRAGQRRRRTRSAQRGMAAAGAPARTETAARVRGTRRRRLARASDARRDASRRRATATGMVRINEPFACARSSADPDAAGSPVRWYVASGAAVVPPTVARPRTTAPYGPRQRTTRAGSNPASRYPAPARA